MSQKEKNQKNENMFHWDLIIENSQLSKRELYLAEHCRQRKFMFLLNDAKKFWVQNGGTLSVRDTVEQGDYCVHHYEFADLRNAMAYYVKHNPDRIKEMDRESSRRYRLRQKNKIAIENVSKGMSPFVYRGRVAWTSTLTPSKDCVALAESGYYPTVQNDKIVWQWAPVRH